MNGFLIKIFFFRELLLSSAYYTLIAFPFVWGGNFIIGSYNINYLKIDYGLAKGMITGSPTIKYLLDNYDWGIEQKKWLRIHYIYALFFGYMGIYLLVSVSFLIVISIFFPEVKN